MDKCRKKHALKKVCLLGLSLAVLPVFAAKPINLNNQKLSLLQSIISAPAAKTPAIGLREVRRSVGQKHILHVRVQETYLGYPVFGTDSILHLQNASKSAKLASLLHSSQGELTGMMYGSLTTDLGQPAAFMLDKAQADKALHNAVAAFETNAGAKFDVSHGESRLIVFVDDNHQAHYAYQVIFEAEPTRDGLEPATPVYIMDATTLKTYKEWNAALSSTNAVQAGGYGGNGKTGKLIYDNLADPLHFSSFSVDRDGSASLCYMQNNEVVVKDKRGAAPVDTTACKTDPTHNNLYWTGTLGYANGGYSPDNDVMYGAQVTYDMFDDWFQIPVVAVTNNNDGSVTQLPIKAKLHFAMSNSIYSPFTHTLSIGDGDSITYPFTSRDYVTHEFGHAFTMENSALGAIGEPGAVNESFGDMTAKAVEFYLTHSNTWTIGGDLTKFPDHVMRYMDQPSKDCGASGKPGNECSIDNVSQFNPNLNPHFGAGIFNRVFYLLSTAPGMDTQKAYTLMLYANMNYWVSKSSFQEAACGLMKEAAELSYDTQATTALVNALQAVGLNADIMACTA